MISRFLKGIVIVTTLTAPYLGFAQNDLFEQYQNVHVPSPEVASLSKLVEVPVSLFNGVPDISIPLYQITEGDIKVPITLRYHASGIRVSEEASWTGLGWSLECGGSINVSINNKDDLGYGGYANPGVPLPALLDDFDNAHYERATLSNCEYTSEIGSSYDYYSSIRNLDGEPDLYTYNFHNLGGKFIFKKYWPSTSIVSETFTGANIQFVHEGLTMKAVTPDGFKYSFGESEYSQVYHAYEDGVVVGARYSDPVTTGFNLTKIQSPLGREVNFFYGSKPPYQQGVRTMNFTFYHTVGEDGGSNKFVSSHPESYGVLLDRVEFSQGVIKFIKSSRQDLPNAWKLDEMQIYNKNGTLIKKFVFNYGYFEGALQYGDQYGTHGGVSHPNYTENFRKLRLKLISLDEVAPDGSKLTHQFFYNSTSLPYKTSFAADYWGFFNGIAGNNTLLPSGQLLMKYYRVPNWLTWFQGANRDPNEQAMQAGILTEIKFPTSGSAKFFYESNRFTNDIGGTQQVSKWASSFNPVAGSPDAAYNNPVSEEFTIADQILKVEYGLHARESQVVRNPAFCMSGGFDNCMWVVLEKKNVSGAWESVRYWYLQGDTYAIDGSENVSVTAGTYRVKAHYPDQYNGDIRTNHFCTIGAQYFVPSNVLLLGGGLRVSKIEYSDPVTSNSTKKKYTYVGGLNLNLPVFTHQTDGVFPTVYCYGSLQDGCCPDQTCSQVQQGKAATIYSDMALRYSNSANGSLVGYAVVTEELEGQQNGKTEYEFTIRTADNVPEYSYPGVQTENILDNGLIRFQRDFKYENNQYIKVREVENIYDHFNKKRLWGFKTEFKIPKVMCSGPSQYSCFVCDQVMLHFYPIRIANVGLKTSYERLVANGIYETKKEFDYNARGYLSSEKMTNSNGDILLKELKYPNDYTATNGWLFDLREKNMINVPLETVSKVNGNTVGGSFLKYKTANSMTIPSEVYKIETQTPAAISSTAPTGTIPSSFKLDGTIEYDVNGNVSYTRAADNLATSYIWGYDNGQVIAVVQNALPTQIYHTSFEEATTNTSATARTGAKGYSAAFTVPLPSAGGTYRLTYWRKVGTADWELVETTMTANTTIGGGTNTIIDEVRVFPATATMVTYTHDPLVGATSITDLNNIVTYYEYDALGRLIIIRNDKRKIVKTYSYNYKQ
jgi:YD repeat-containing protein